MYHSARRGTPEQVLITTTFSLPKESRTSLPRQPSPSKSFASKVSLFSAPDDALPKLSFSLSQERKVARIPAVFLGVISGNQVALELHHCNLGKIAMKLYDVHTPNPASNRLLERKVANIVAACVVAWLEDFCITAGSLVDVGFVSFTGKSETRFCGFLHPSPLSNTTLNIVMLRSGLAKDNPGEWTDEELLAILGRK